MLAQIGSKLPISPKINFLTKGNVTIVYLLFFHAKFKKNSQTANHEEKVV